MESASVLPPDGSLVRLERARLAADPGALIRGLAAKTMRKTLRAAAAWMTRTEEGAGEVRVSSEALAIRGCVALAEAMDRLHVDTDNLDADTGVEHAERAG